MTGESGTQTDEDVWCEVEADGSDGVGPAVAEILESVADVLRDAPADRRYDFELIVEEDNAE